MFRAKLKVDSVESRGDDKGCIVAESIKMSAVSAGQYSEDGADEDNTFAMFTPSADLSITISNPDLLGEIKIGQEFYVDFTLLGIPVPGEELSEVGL